MDIGTYPALAVGLRRDVRLVDRPCRVHGSAAGPGAGRGPARGHRPGLEERRRLDLNRAISLWCRTASIPKNLPQDVKDAAFYFIYRMSHPDYSDEIVADEYLRLRSVRQDPLRRRGRQLYLQANPQRGHNELWSTNGHLQELRDRRTISMPVWPMSRWAIRSSSGRRAGIRRRPGSQHLQGDLRRADQRSRRWTRRPRNGSRSSQKLGLDKQKAQYKNFIDGARALGYKI